MILPSLVGLARQSRYFFLCSQEKVSKKKATPQPFYPVLLILMCGNRTRPSKRYKTSLAAELKQAIAETSHQDYATRHG